MSNNQATDIATTPVSDSTMEQVVIGGDLSKLSPQDRVSYYRRVCESVGLNPFTKPFQYIRLNGFLTLYAAKDCTEQLRRIHGISITGLTTQFDADVGVYTVVATAQARDGRTDSATGAVPLGNDVKGEERANAVMKAETKAKRRVTLSICGLGWLDESETGSITGAQVVDMHDDLEALPGGRVAAREAKTVVDEETGEIIDDKTPPTQGEDMPIPPQPTQAPQAGAASSPAQTPPPQTVAPNGNPTRFTTMGDFMAWANGEHGKTSQDVVNLARQLYPNEEIGNVTDVARHKDDPQLIAAVQGART